MGARLVTGTRDGALPLVLERSLPVVPAQMARASGGAAIYASRDGPWTVERGGVCEVDVAARPPVFFSCEVALSRCREN